MVKKIGQGPLPPNFFYGVPLGAFLIALILSNILMCRERIAQAEQTVTGPCVIHCNTLHCRVWCFPLSGIGLQPIVKSGFCVFLWLFFQSFIYHVSGKGGPIKIYDASSIILPSDWLSTAYLLGKFVQQGGEEKIMIPFKNEISPIGKLSYAL